MARDKWRGTLSAYKIADAYHMKAMAILLQYTFGLPDPPLPHALLPEGSEAVNSWSEVDFVDVTFNTTLQLLGSNPNISNSVPNPTDWLDPAPPPSATVYAISSSSLPPTSTAQPSPSAPNRAILISYQQVFVSLEPADSFLATAFTPGDSSLGDPCNANSLGTGKVSNGDTSLPASMDVTFEGEQYTFTTQTDDVAGQLVESDSGGVVASCEMLLAPKEQTCGIEGYVILTPRAMCEWYE
ncbi:hypothetical protein IMSHALPRED_010507 [Imshaugia aleurites]|uniref:Uncharacterized protein n=1 Tax=Imshaugia aleurites TaxID=172621 RepID=A0A8H3IZW2_9LECA|nr:hypothetical protein IMSHALPRED_010507 [Imshaugia aleurites]